MTIKFKIEGLKSVEKALLELEKAATRKTVVRNALKKAAVPIASAMGTNAARTPEPKIGASILIGTKIKGEAGKAAYTQSMRQGFNKAAALKAMRDARRAAKGSMPPVIIYVGPSERFSMSHFWEFGIAPHVNGGTFAGTRHPGVRPTPFIRPAWDSQREAALTILKAEMVSQIQKAAKRQSARKANRG